MHSDTNRSLLLAQGAEEEIETPDLQNDDVQYRRNLAIDCLILQGRK
jgi:hypothetical protein